MWFIPAAFTCSIRPWRAKARQSLRIAASVFLLSLAAGPDVWSAEQPVELQSSAGRSSDAPMPADLRAQEQPPADTQNAKRGIENPEGEGTEFWPMFLGLRLKITDTLIAFFTLVLAIFTALLWWSTNKLWFAAREQGADMKASIAIARQSAEAAERAADAAIAAQRPWISAQITETAQLTFDKHEARLSIEVAIENIGNSPATRVNVLAEMAPQEVGPHINYAIPRDKIRKISTQVRNAGAGVSLFPGQRQGRNLVAVVPIFEISNVAGMIKNKAKILLTLAVSVEYEFFGKLGNTGSIYTVWRRDGDIDWKELEGQTITVDCQKIPKEDVAV